MRAGRVLHVKNTRTALLAVLAFAWSTAAHPAEIKSRGRLVFDCVPKPVLRFSGPVGQRIDNNVDRWLTQAPDNNPGLLDMFARRDLPGGQNLVPWAGEFVGKYLISGVQAMRMSEDPRLRQTLQKVVDRLVQLQAEDGYLGPWPKQARLRGHWDLWGHYHVMLGLMLWYEHTGDRQAAAAAKRIGEKVCNTCLDTGFRVIHAGSPEMNMAIIHGMARLHRKTGDPRFLRMAREVLQDFEQAGDYYRTGLAGEEFYRTPKPRWESLHSLQGMVQLYEITGDDTFRTAFLNHWASMRRFDYRNTGGFSSGEQATGNPYAGSAIETCCVVAWECVMIDALRLTGNAVIADDLELTLFNAVFGSQHPSGAWCTYNTPMAGQRIPSHVQISFQARKNAPHLNCCSVNGPRGYGMLSEWAVMRSRDGLVLNYYGPMTARLALADGTPVTITETTEYPFGDGTVKITVDTPGPKQFMLRLRLPHWSPNTRVRLAGRAVPVGKPGSYLVLDRTWQPGDRIDIRFDTGLRYEAGDIDRAGRASFYRGPVLLALDDRFRTDAETKVDANRLDRAEVVPIDEKIAQASGEYAPWLVVDVPNVDGRMLRLVDFASAGATQLDGKPRSSYATWLPATKMRPSKPAAFRPPDRLRIGRGPIRFAWRASSGGASRYTVVVSEDPSFRQVALRATGTANSSLVISAERIAKLRSPATYYWKIVAENEHGVAHSIPPYKRFVIDPSVRTTAGEATMGARSSDGMLTAAPLHGRATPEYGRLLAARGFKPAAGPKGKPGGAVELSGTDGIIKYKLFEFPSENYTVSIRVALTRPHGQRYGQIFSAWARSMDDPLRLVVIDNSVSARIEAGRFYGTKEIPLTVGRWTHLTAVKQSEKLTLYVDGKPRATTKAPAVLHTLAREFALGGNPRYGGPEFLACKLSGLKFYARALSAADVRRLHEAGGIWGQAGIRD